MLTPPYFTVHKCMVCTILWHLITLGETKGKKCESRRFETLTSTRVDKNEPTKKNRLKPLIQLHSILTMKRQGYNGGRKKAIFHLTSN